MLPLKEVNNSPLQSANSKLSLREIVQPILPSLQEVEKNLAAIAEESEGILKESSRYVLSAGGKRFRASLVLFCASISKNNNFQSSIFNLEFPIKIATAVELIHSATLVHDDIIDRAVLRRLKPTVHVEFGEEVAILLGDFLYARAFELIAQVGDTKITEWLSSSTRRMCEGELDQLLHRYQADLPLDDYFSFVERKTASLISAACRCGAHLGGLSAELVENLATYGLNIGLAYQMIDDLLDVIGNERRLGKTMHADAGNGKLTLPLILLKDALSEQERKKFVRDFRALAPDWDTIQKQFSRFSIAKKIEEMASSYRQRAWQAIEAIPAPYQTYLKELSIFILNRDY